jgi:hypothetical protein
VYGYFDAVTDYVAFTKTAALNFGASTSFSVSAFVKASSVTGDPVIVGDKNWNSGSYAGFVVSLSTGGTIWANVGSGSARIDLKSTVPVTDGAWHQVVLVVDRAGAVGTLYIDGVFVVSSPLGSLASVTTTYPVVIGQDGTQAYSDSHTGTSIDEVRIWTRAFTAAEVASSYSSLCAASSAASAPFASSLVLHARLSEGGGPVTADTARPGSFGAVRGSSVWAFAAPC